eukprot:CAMPEP_0113619304 /NCGR_PEP_ID=MMETSP0017_2-20120614/9800_1 /TAXON_ID=2856 /ORGANISM="Cylindrotheca closterium" /LENGTH=581 /DNA_ID=CAMNT_0000528873 /DNA_START=88 /DNA_END=1833 /DNA_ORIENTATION=+ /assembly_acc=CAM_ASM_000147
MATEVCLIPSQALSHPSHSVGAKWKPKKKQMKGQTVSSLIPSQVQASSSHIEGSSMEATKSLSAQDDDSLPTSSPSSSGNPNGNDTGEVAIEHGESTRSNGIKNINKTKKKKSNSGKKNGKKGKNTKKNNNNNNSSPQIRRHGNFPDVFWRCVPMEHLRQHPNFVPLPLPESIDHIAELEDIRWFRQESWQWDAIHEGRCTTSQAVAALGFLEPKAGRILGVPRSFHRGGMGAYQRLRRPALRTLEEMNAVLCSQNHNASSGHQSTSSQQLQQQQEDSSIIWLPYRGGGGNTKNQFASRYCIPVDEDDRQQRRQEMKHQYHHSSNVLDYSVRMTWGNTQESTALLTALNYFVQQVGPDVKLCEIGMCGAGVQLEGSKLLLGATPDGVICHPGGRKEILEVKNHCPFFESGMRNNNNNRSQSRFAIRPGKLLASDGTKKAGVFPHYVPQLMMEMYCMGPECQSAIMVRQTATAGALIIRIYRDDEWIQEMLYWLQRFQSDYVDTGTPPPPNFFLVEPNNSSEEEETAGVGVDHNASRARYRKFLDWTIDLESKVDLLDHVPNNRIQRAHSATPGTLVDLFLD